VPSQRGILGLGKILDLEGAARHLAEVLEVPGCVQVEGDALTVTGPGGSAQLDRDLTLAVLIGAPDVRDDVRSLLARLGFDRVALPLQPFAWGLDSI
jgi:hypothetical protein